MSKFLKLFPTEAKVLVGQVDRSKFGPGPWDEEPDRIQWRDPETGRVCLIKRNSMGNLCGYVGVGPQHPWHNEHYNDVPAEVHGGLTYGSHCDDDPIKGICHVAEGIEPDHMYWLGFDCSHFSDLTPRFSDGGTYRDMEYVRNECHALAKQAVAAKKENACPI